MRSIIKLHMRILTFLNVSNRSRMQADSGYIFYNLLSPYFTKNNSFYFASPEPLADSKCIHISKEFGFNKYEVRFSFDWSKVMEIISSIRPDVLIVNQIEQVPHYKAIVQALGIKVLIASYAHYIPYLFTNEGFQYDESLNNGGIGFSICMSFLSGLEMSDLVFTHSHTSKEYLKKLYDKFHIPFFDEKFIINPPPYDPFLLDNNTQCDKRIIYNHRLYKHYGTDFLFRLAENIISKYQVEIDVFDVLGERTEIQKRMDSSVDTARDTLSKMKNVKLINDTYNRRRYFECLKGSLFSIAPYRQNCIWAMSCIDSLGMGVPVIAPDIAWFSEYIPRDLRYSSVDEAMSIIDKLIKDHNYWKEKSIEANNLITSLSPELIANAFLDTFYRFIL